MENVALAMMLCCQKLTSEGHWQPYIKVLPESFNTPLFFTVEQLKVSELIHRHGITTCVKS